MCQVSINANKKKLTKLIFNFIHTEKTRTQKQEDWTMIRISNTHGIIQRKNEQQPRLHYRCTEQTINGK